MIFIVSVMTYVFTTFYWPYFTLVLFQLMVYNIVENYYSFVREIGQFQNLVDIERKNLQLQQFVDRLLPRNVSHY